MLSNGIYAASLTPMHEDLSCNYEEFAAHCNDLMRRGCSGVLVFGTTGEGSSFAVDEREKALEKIIALGVNPQKIIPVINCCAIQDTIRLTRHAVSQRCPVVLIGPPFYYKKIDQAGILAFYKKVIQEARHSELKILLYHIPQYSGISITIDLIKTLREEFPNTLMGIKESEGNMAFTKQVLTTFPGFKVFVGHELQITEAVQLGASGGISGLANAYPELICSLYQSGNSQHTLQNIIETLKGYPLFPAIKYLVEKQKGNAWHALRPPLLPLSHGDNLDSIL
jgi:4-hydroxy-tetrahydrodipicolinate synthase